MRAFWIHHFSIFKNLLRSSSASISTSKKLFLIFQLFIPLSLAGWLTIIAFQETTKAAEREWIHTHPVPLSLWHEAVTSLKFIKTTQFGLIPVRLPPPQTISLWMSEDFNYLVLVDPFRQDDSKWYARGPGLTPERSNWRYLGEGFEGLYELYRQPNPDSRQLNLKKRYKTYEKWDPRQIRY